jgi:hypothetical protein
MTMRWEWEEEEIHVDAPDFVGNYSTVHINDATTDEEVILARVLVNMRPGERQRGYLYGTCIYSLLLLLYLCIEQILPQRTSGSADYSNITGWRQGGAAYYIRGWNMDHWRTETDRQ